MREFTGITSFNELHAVWGQIVAYVNLNEGKSWDLILKPTEARQRTLKQNSSIHVYCRELAKALNEAGLDMRKVLKPEVDIPWTEETAKENLWKPIQEALLNIDSTKDLTTEQVSKVYDTLNRHLADKFGVSVPFPQKEES